MPEILSQYSPRELARWRILSIVFALVAFGIGAAALFGWIFDNELLKRIHPQLVTMKANTAVCLMLVSVCIVLLQDRSLTSAKRRIVQVCAAVVGVVGLITFTEHLFGWNPGLDQLLFHETTDEAGLSFPGRMGVAASLDFFLLGIALLTIDARSKRWFRISNLAVLLVIAITVLVFLYYFYGIEKFEPAELYFTIALHTVAAFLSICAAILLARPDRGVIASLLGNSPGAVVARRMWPALLIVIMLGWIRTNGRSEGWFSAGFATAVFVLLILLLLVALIWWTAVSLNRSDRERHRVDLALRHSESRLTALLEQLPVGIGLTDREGRFLLRNSLLNNFVGDRLSSLDPVLSTRWRAWSEDGRLLDPSEWPSARALKGESVTPGTEMLYTADDGKQIWTRVLCVPFRDQSDEVDGVIVVVQNIDEQRRA
ncbi:MAG TPA: PAS domain S-box protein, partial [Pyrinomonadaceae bacterium]|nr:PAS domain S-box protein [Pyrinomonadaceae bacterium]